MADSTLETSARSSVRVAPVAPVAVGRAASVPGVAAPGLVVPGLVASGLVVPGLVVPGLVASGLVASGLVVPGLVVPEAPAPVVRSSPRGIRRQVPGERLTRVAARSWPSARWP